MTIGSPVTINSTAPQRHLPLASFSPAILLPFHLAYLGSRNDDMSLDFSRDCLIAVELCNLVRGSAGDSLQSEGIAGLNFVPKRCSLVITDPRVASTGGGAGPLDRFNDDIRETG